MKKPGEKQIPIYQGKGANRRITGYLTVYYSAVHDQYFSIPTRD